MRGCACRGRETGCTVDPPRGRSRCDNCSAVHNAREAERRATRRKAALCVVCGRPAVTKPPAAADKVAKPPATAGKKRSAKRRDRVLTLCAKHRKYFVLRSRSAKRSLAPEKAASG